VQVLGTRLQQLGRAGPLAVLLDYDGTLVPFSPTRIWRSPTPSLMSRSFARRGSRQSPASVSGRPREPLDEWFGALPVSLWAEHACGAPAGAADWSMTAVPALEWMAEAEGIIDRTCAETPGSFHERKIRVDRVALPDGRCRVRGGARSCELESLLRERFAGAPVAILKGAACSKYAQPASTRAWWVQRVIAASRPGAVGGRHRRRREDEDMSRRSPTRGCRCTSGRGPPARPHGSTTGWPCARSSA